MYGSQNPYYGAFPQRYEIIHVNGRNGAEAFMMAPNSSVLLLDENNPLVWFVQTDGAGYKTVAPYDIKPHEQEKQPDFTTLEDRIKRLEEKLNESNNAKPAKKQPSEQ